MIRPPIIAGARVTGALGNKFVSMLVHVPLLVTAAGVLLLAVDVSTLIRQSFGLHLGASAQFRARKRIGRFLLTLNLHQIHLPFLPRQQRRQ